MPRLSLLLSALLLACPALAAATPAERPEVTAAATRLKAKVGEITMANELLYAKIDKLEGGRPFGWRRLKP